MSPSIKRATLVQVTLIRPLWITSNPRLLRVLVSDLSFQVVKEISR